MGDGKQHAVVLRFGDFELDGMRFELRRSGAPVPIQPRVLDLLLYLAEHRDRVVTKDELLETVWGGVSVTDSSLSQAVRQARRALDDSTREQRTIRTIRGRGFHFVAPVQAGAAAGSAPAPATGLLTEPPVSSSPPESARLVLPGTSPTAAETQKDSRRHPAPEPHCPFLFVVLHCDTPALGGACHALADIDEVHIGRTSTRIAERSTEAATHKLRLGLPGNALSRRHARLVRGHRDAWYVVDEGSRNGTSVNGETTKRHALGAGDLVECGRTLLSFSTLAAGADTPPSIDWKDVVADIVPSLLPTLGSLSRDLSRVATTHLPLLLVGEVGSGRTRTAKRVHAVSKRRGAPVVLEAAASSQARIPELLFGTDGAVARAEGGTLIVREVDQLPTEVQSALACLLGTGRLERGDGAVLTTDARVVATSRAPLVELSASGQVVPELAAQLSGFSCTLPPLRERRVDLGGLIADLLRELDAQSLAFEPAAGRALLLHDWPGNLHELRRCMEVITALAGHRLVARQDLPPQVRG